MRLSTSFMRFLVSAILLSLSMLLWQCSQGECTYDTDCSSSMVCKDNVCASPQQEGCILDTDCGAGELCFQSICVPGGKKEKAKEKSIDAGSEEIREVQPEPEPTQEKVEFVPEQPSPVMCKKTRDCKIIDGNHYQLVN